MAHKAMLQMVIIMEHMIWFLQSNYRDEVALIPNQLANKTLKWETLIQSNIGFDASLFKSRVNIVLIGIIKILKILLPQYHFLT